MKAPFSLAALFLFFVGVSCQPPTVPPAQTPQTAIPASEAGAHASSDAMNAVDATVSDQPDDPGMTRKHDKTLIQEQPSGDESSRAAPNDGDAEPPQ